MATRVAKADTKRRLPPHDLHKEYWCAVCGVLVVWKGWEGAEDRAAKGCWGCHGVGERRRAVEEAQRLRNY